MSETDTSQPKPHRIDTQTKLWIAAAGLAGSLFGAIVGGTFAITAAHINADAQARAATINANAQEETARRNAVRTLQEEAIVTLLNDNDALTSARQPVVSLVHKSGTTTISKWQDLTDQEAKGEQKLASDINQVRILLSATSLKAAAQLAGAQSAWGDLLDADIVKSFKGNEIHVRFQTPDQTIDTDPYDVKRAADAFAAIATAEVIDR